MREQTLSNLPVTASDGRLVGLLVREDAERGPGSTRWAEGGSGHDQNPPSDTRVESSIKRIEQMEESATKGDPMAAHHRRRAALVFLFAAIGAALLLAQSASAGGFTHGIVVEVDGQDYYFAGAPDGPGGAQDVPGHYWVQAGPDQLVGKHCNTGPFGAPRWWSSDAPDGELLYSVHAIIDTWTEAKAARYAQRGYVHYHELVSVADGSLHPTKVAWLRHIARTSFTLDGGPHPEFSHTVTPGIDREFIPNWMTPYTP